MNRSSPCGAASLFFPRFCPLVAVFLAASLRADTVVLNTGGMVYDAKILREEGGKVHLRTPGGLMGIPRSEIRTIKKEKSVFDAYDEKRAKLRKFDSKGQWSLAKWCIQDAGLRQEACELLKEVLDQESDHPDARRYLGYFRVGTEWRQAPPLEVRVNLLAGKEQEKDLREQLEVILPTRTDIRLAKDAPAKNQIDGCDLAVTITTGQNTESRFYGQLLRGPTTHVTVKLSPQAKWIVVPPADLEIFGEVPAGVPNPPGMAVVDAMTQNAKNLHDFFDKLNQLRLKRLEILYKPKADDKKGAKKGEKAGKPADPKKKTGKA